MLYLFSGQYAFMALMLAVGLAMASPVLFFTRESNVKFMSRYLLTGANLAVFFLQCISGNYEPAVLFAVGCTYLSLCAGELIGSAMVLGELLSAIFIAFGQ